MSHTANYITYLRYLQCWLLTPLWITILFLHYLCCFFFLNCECTFGTCTWRIFEMKINTHRVAIWKTRRVASIPLSFGCFLGGGLSVGFTLVSLLDPSILSLNIRCKILSQVTDQSIIWSMNQSLIQKTLGHH